MTREAFIRKWLANPQKQYNEQCRDEMRDDLDNVIKYAQQQVKNLNIPAVIKCEGNERKTLLIDFIGWYLNIFMRDKKLTKTKTPIQSVDIFLKSINSL